MVKTPFPFFSFLTKVVYFTLVFSFMILLSMGSAEATRQDCGVKVLNLLSGEPMESIEVTCNIASSGYMYWGGMKSCLYRLNIPYRESALMSSYPAIITFQDHYRIVFGEFLGTYHIVWDSMYGFGFPDKNKYTGMRALVIEW